MPIKLEVAGNERGRKKGCWGDTVNVMGSMYRDSQCQLNSHFG